MSLFPKVIYSTFTKFSGEIKVIEVGRIRRLVVGGLIQSVSHNYPDVETKVWGQLLKPSLPINKNPKILMLGLGGGTTAHLAAQLLSPVIIRAVEIDPRVVEVAKSFFDLENINNLEVINADVFAYLAKSLEEKFDLVIVDLYLGQNFPKEALKKSFYRKIKRQLNIGGVVSVNRIFPQIGQVEKKKFLDLLYSVFSEVHEKVLPGPSSAKNYLYFCRV